MSKISVEDQMRIKEEIAELVERYGLENIKAVFSDFLSASAGTDQLIQGQQQKVEQEEAAEVQSRKKYKEEEFQGVQLPPTVLNLEQYVNGVNKVLESGQVNPDYALVAQDFARGADMIFKNDYSDKNFIMSLTTRLFEEKAISNPYEDWIDYNSEKLRKLLKRHLRLKGYQFLDSEVEVGKTFDSTKHNVVRKDPVDNAAMDQRILKVLSEGLIIGRNLHINCNVVVGQFIQQGT